MVPRVLCPGWAVVAAGRAGVALDPRQGCGEGWRRTPLVWVRDRQGFQPAVWPRSPAEGSPGTL